MARDTDSGQPQTVDLNRGLFTVHYESADDKSFPPRVIVTPAHGYERQIQIITHPDAEDDTLWHPKTSLVVLAKARCALEFVVHASRPGGSKAASVKIEPVTQGEAPTDADAEADAEDINLDTIKVLGHVAGVGDVMVATNEWIAGPRAPSRIEGLAIQWPDRPKGFELSYGVKTGTGQGPVETMISSGEFAGTRGRALPITGLVLEIAGGLARDYALTVDAIFLNSPTTRMSGKKIVLSGPTGREPLVGLRVQIDESVIDAFEAPARRPAKVAERTRARSAAAAPEAPARAAPNSRVRVFRSRPKQTTE